MPSKEGYRIVWVWNSLMAQEDAGAQRWVRVDVTDRQEPVFRQEQRGRPGRHTRHIRRWRLRVSVAARVKDDVVKTDERSDQHLAPVWFKNVSRIEALLFLYFTALLVHALLERILDVFAPLQRHRLHKGGRLVQVFEPELTDL